MASMAALWGNIASFIPNLIAALLIVLLGFIVAKAVDTVLSKGLARLGLDRLMAGAVWSCRFLRWWARSSTGSSY